VTLIAWVALLMLTWIWDRKENIPLVDLRGSGKASAVVLVRVAVTAFWIVLTSLSDDAARAATCAWQGDAVRYVHPKRHLPLIGRIRIPRLEAEPVDPGDATQVGAKLLYLGEADGTAVVWDASPHVKRCRSSRPSST
jgi:hypothetical protein